jgi:hypothetical protein
MVGRVEAHGSSLRGLAFSATTHCLTGCAIGEVLGMVIGTALDWEDFPTIALSVVLAFFFGYLLTLRPLLAAGVAFAWAAQLALAADTISITIMEIVDNAMMLAIPGRDGCRTRRDSVLGQPDSRACGRLRRGIPGELLAYPARTRACRRAWAP